MSKIVFTGPSGTGKTTWAKHIETKFGIPFISLAGGSLWPKYGIKTHEEVISRSIQNPGWGFQYEWELLELREKTYKENSSFVSDRSSICNLVYSLMQIGHVLSKEDTEKLMEFALRLHKEIDLTLYLSYDADIYNELDPKRIKNPYYQLTTDAVFSKVISELFLPNSDMQENAILQIHSIDRDERSLAIDEIMKEVFNIEIPNRPKIITQL